MDHVVSLSWGFCECDSTITAPWRKAKNNPQKSDKVRVWAVRELQSGFIRRGTDCSSKVTRAKREIQKIYRGYSQAVRDFYAAVRASSAAGAPPWLLIDEGHCALIDRCTLFWCGGRSLTSE